MNTSGTAKRILVVDDDPNIRRFVSESLQLRGYEVDSFTDAEAAITALGTSRFDLALLDILLPGTNGLQLCHKLRQRPDTRDLPIIMMTAFYKQADHIREAREQYGATDYLLKPFPIKALHEKIAQFIGPATPAPEAGRLSIAGDLNETPLPRILHNLYSLQATGLLHLEQDSVKKVVYIRNGYPIFVRSNLVREFLGQILVQHEILSEADLNHSLEIARQKGQRHGVALVELGLISPQQLDEILHKQVVDKLLEIFSWRKGVYRYIQAREFKPGIINIDQSPANVILQGLRGHAHRDQIQQLLEPHLDHYLQQAENPLYRFQEIELTANEQKIFEQCQGHLTTNQLLDHYRLSRYEVEPLLAALLTTGILIGRTEPTQPDQDSPQAQAEKQQALRKEFLKDYAWMMEQDYFTLLGVSETASRDQIRKSYYNLVKSYHPDRFFEQDLFIDLKEQVNNLFKKINTAHETLIDSTAKARYTNELKGLTTNEPRQNLDNILQAENAFQKGVVYFRANKFPQALEAFEQALKLNPEEIEYLLYQAWTSYKAVPQDNSRRASAKQKLLNVIQRNPRLAQAHLYLGYLYKDEGGVREARKHFERAIQLNPNGIEALRELRLMNMRQEKDAAAKKGILGKLLRK